MYHLPLYTKLYNEELGEYDFSPYYEKMKEYMDSTDLMVGNYETTINTNRKISGFPMFNTPKESVKYLKNQGFDLLTTANNHCLDTGIDGINDTIDSIREVGLLQTGTFKEGEKYPLIVDVKGIKIGILAYSDLFNGMEGMLPESEKYRINPLSQEQIIEDVRYLKDNGAEFIICYPHWGVEYRTTPTDRQVEFADFMFQNGIDVVLGSHPHVLQRSEVKNINGKDRFLIYSMGNSIANQRKEWMGNHNSEMGVFVELSIEKENGEVKLTGSNIVLTHNNRVREKGYTEVVPVNDTLNGKFGDIDENYRARLLKIKDLGADILWKE